MATKTKATKKETDVAKREDASLVPASDFGAFENTGFEDCGKDDYALPFLNIIQANSPQVDEAKVEYDADAKKGEIINSVTGERVDGKTGIVFQPCCREHKFIEYVPRDNGGGLVAIHEPDSAVVAKSKAASTEFGKYKVPAVDKDGVPTGGNNELVETFSWYGNVLSDDGEEQVGQAIISFTSTKIKVYRKAMSTMDSFMLPTASGGKGKVPLYANRLRITTGTQINKAQTSYNFNIAPLHGSLKDSVLASDGKQIRLGYEFYKIASAGQAKVDYNAGQASSGRDEDSNIDPKTGKPLF